MGLASGAGVRATRPALKGTHPVQALRAQFREGIGAIPKSEASVSEAESEPEPAQALTCCVSHSQHPHSLGLSFPICKMERDRAGTGQACRIQPLLSISWT